MVTDAEHLILSQGELRITGRLVDASNATLYAINTLGNVEISCIYKPVAGEKPLWDFSQGTLANREYAAFLTSRYLGLDIVPLTVLRDGPFGFGMVQKWIEIDESIDLGTLFSKDHPQLRKMALFDAIINNTDRKIGHLLPINADRILGCDHGVTFHVDDKLRTVLWQWAGEEFSADEITILSKARDGLRSDLKEQLEPLLTPHEIESTLMRVQRLIESSCFPEPNPNWPAIPWPAF